MKNVAWAAVLLPLSFGINAETGGYEAGKTAPPQQNQDAGYKGTEDTHETPVTLIKDFRQGGYVTLEGNIVKRIDGDAYQFQDSSGTVKILAPTATFKGKTYSAEDKVRVSGKVFGKGNNAHLEVSRIDVP